MGVAKVAIIGRPNVGKSSIFNWLIGERVSIVDSTAGVTRDRVSYILDIGLDGVDEKYLLPDAAFLSESSGDENSSREEDEKSERVATSPEANNAPDSETDVANSKSPRISARFIELIDSGGIGIVDKDDLSEDVEQQIQAAIDLADLILFVVDARDGVAPLDEYVAERLRKLQVPILLVANKCDGETQEYDSREFYRFGWGVIPVSAKQKRGRSALMDAVEKTLPISAFFDDRSDAYAEPEMKIAIVGRRNVGKSTFINTLVQEERVIASPVPGTTRDCIDVRFEMDGKSFIAIDTPGFMRKKSLGSDLDFYALTRAERSIRTADVVLMFFDCSSQIAKMDKQLVALIESYNKPCIFVVNKWDKMVEYGMPTGRWADYLRETFATMWYVPIAFITGMTGKNVSKLLQHTRALFRQSKMRVPTNRLNKLIAAALNHTPPPLFHYHKPKIYYAAQISVAPPTIVLFCNMPDAFSQSYRRFLLNVIRDELPIGETPIRLWFRKRETDDLNDEIDRRRIT